MIISDRVAQRAAEAGLRVREYAPQAGSSVQCTVAVDDDVLLARLTMDLTTAGRVDLSWCDPQGIERQRNDGHPRFGQRGNVICQQSITWAKGSPSSTMIARLLAIDDEGDERVLGEYTFHHTRTIPGRPPGSCPDRIAGHQKGENRTMDDLKVLVGEWSLEMTMPGGKPSGDVGARVTFEPMGKKFLVERWTIPVPEAPDGIAVIGYDEGRGTLLQHYFDERGVARVYEMSLENGVWKLERTKPDFSPLQFTQRFKGTFSEDRRTIDGRWEICTDGVTWEHDFDLTYRKLS